MSRSSLLTYWTGKHIERNPDNLNEHTRTEYLEILWSILDEGIWMNKIQEEILGWSDKGPDSIISMEVPMVCFTELRLSQSLPHRARYGLLGIVVDRQFVLKRHGAPVFYIPSHADESIVGNLFQTLDWINKQPNPKKTGADQLLQNFFVPISYLKAMSSPGSDDFQNLDENEWRIVHTDRLQQQGLFISTGKERPAYIIPLIPTDLKMIVLPDSQVRDRVIEDDRFVDWFDHKFPPLLTVGKIGEF